MKKAAFGMIVFCLLNVGVGLLLTNVGYEMPLAPLNMTLFLVACFIVSMVFLLVLGTGTAEKRTCCKRPNCGVIEPGAHKSGA